MKLDVGMLTLDLKSISAYAWKVEAPGFDPAPIEHPRIPVARRARRAGAHPSPHRKSAEGDGKGMADLITD